MCCRLLTAALEVSQASCTIYRILRAKWRDHRTENVLFAAPKLLVHHMYHITDYFFVNY